MDHTIPIQNHIPKLLEQIEGSGIEEALSLLAAIFPGRVVFSTSFGIEDQVITHQILSEKISIPIFTLDTGRLFAETYSVWSATNEKYFIRRYRPIIHLTGCYWRTISTRKAPNAFYEASVSQPEAAAAPIYARWNR